MWSETVGLRTRPVKIGLDLGLAHCSFGLGSGGFRGGAPGATPLFCNPNL